MQHKLIYDPIIGNIELSSLETQVLKSPFVNRLHQIIQNSTAYLTYPSCKTSRFEHSLGVMDYSSKIFINGYTNTDPITRERFISDKSELLRNLILKDFEQFSEFPGENIHSEQQTLVFEKFCKKFNFKIHEFIKDENACSEINKYAKELFGNVFIDRHIGGDNQLIKPTNLFVLMLLIQTVRLYGLFHDIGHLPFSHVFEFALEYSKEAFPNDKNPKNSEFESQTLKELNDLFAKQEGQIHEGIGEKVAKLVLKEISINICSKYTENIDEEEEKRIVFQWVVINCISLFFDALFEYKEKSGLFSVKSIVAGPIDADRLDYIQRDGKSSGISVSPGNIERIIKFFFLIEDDSLESTDKFRFLPSIQSLHDIENVLYNRFNIYKFMINHHSVKRSDYVLQKNIEFILKQEIESKSKISGNGNAINSLSGVVHAANNILNNNAANFHRNKALFTQLTDYWLLSFFSSKYFESKLNGEERFSHIALLNEIYESKRSFRSLWKRIYNYSNFIKKLGAEAVELLNDFKDDYFKIITKPEIDAEDISITGYVKRYGLFRELYKIISEKTLLDTLNYRIGRLVIDTIQDLNANIWNRKIESSLEGNNEYLIFLVKTNISVGFSDFKLIDNNNGKDYYNFKEISHLPETLKREKEKVIQFFTYYLRKDNQTPTKDDDDIVMDLLKNALIGELKKIMTNFAPSSDFQAILQTN